MSTKASSCCSYHAAGIKAICQMSTHLSPPSLIFVHNLSGFELKHLLLWNISKLCVSPLIFLIPHSCHGEMPAFLRLNCWQHFEQTRIPWNLLKNLTVSSSSKHLKGAFKTWHGKRERWNYAGPMWNREHLLWLGGQLVNLTRDDVAEASKFPRLHKFGLLPNRPNMTCFSKLKRK